MSRRIHVEQVEIGRLALPAAGAHHVRDVLRLGVGTPVEVFDDAGRVGTGRLAEVGGAAVTVEVEQVREGARDLEWTIASAVPKGQRADWMIEKLAELGVARFVPLATARSVVHPEGRGKVDRWRRLATEAARQSGSGVMQIDGLMPLNHAIEAWAATGTPGLWCATEVEAAGIGAIGPMEAGWCFIGPEGGWDPAEIAQMRQSGLAAVRLTRSILRIETAAVVAAAALLLDREGHRPDDRQSPAR